VTQDDEGALATGKQDYTDPDYAAEQIAKEQRAKDKKSLFGE